jgi:hypothetical protein
MSDIFRKTTLGYEEVVSRAHGLSAPLRRCLIMIDGKRATRDLMDFLKSNDLSLTIQTLEMDGYIELIGSVNDDIAPSTLSMNTTMQVSRMDGMFKDSQPLFTDSNGQLRKALPLAERKLRASRVVSELLGPNAEGIALKIEASKDPAELEMTLRMAASFIGDAVNPIAAKRFKDHVRLRDDA